AGEAALRLLRHGVLVSDRPALVGQGPALRELHDALRAAGARFPLLLHLTPDAPVDPSCGPVFGEPLRAFADTSLQGFAYRTGDGQEERIACDAVLVSTPPVPSFELARQAGAAVTYQPKSKSFVVKADASGKTSAPFVFVCGILSGAHDAESSRASGARTGA